MTKAIQRRLNDSPVARWTALILIALMMFFAYMFVDVLSPLSSMLETDRGWSPEVYGTVVGAEYFLNVFVLFLIFAGIILDKMGIRFTGLLSGGLMLLGAAIKLYGISDYFVGGGFGFEFFNSFWPGFPASAKVACIGFAIFGCGVEMAGITVSKAIAKWFAGKEMALAMGLEMAIARLGVFAVFRLSPRLAEMGEPSVVRPVAIIALLLLIGVITYFVFTIMDRKLDKQIGAESNGEPEEEFKVKDLKNLFTSKTFMIVAFLCVLYYSAIFPFQKFATGMLQSRLGIPMSEASDLFSWFPIGAMVLTPLLGAFLDYRGKGATMLMIGAILMCGCHLIFAFAPLTKPIAYAAIILLGVSFSLVPAALWPSVPKLVENRYLGSGYSVIFWIQNFGLWLTPIIIGAALSAANPEITANVKALNEEIQVYQEELKALPEVNVVLDEATGISADIVVADVDAQVEDAVADVAEPAAGEVVADVVEPVADEDGMITEYIGLEPDATMMIAQRRAELGRLTEQKRTEIQAQTMQYNYTRPMLIFAMFGVLAFILGIWLKRLDKKKGFGLEEPNVKKK